MIMLSNVSREQRAEWSRKGGKVTAERRSPGQRSLAAKVATTGRAAKYSREQLQEIYTDCLGKRLARMAPEEAKEFQRKAAQARWNGVSPEERSRIARRAIQTRLARIAYAKNPAPADRLLAFLREFITAKHYSPTLQEISRALNHECRTIEKLLQMLEAVKKINREPWKRGIVLCIAPIESPALPTGGTESDVLIPAEIVMPRATRKCYQCDAPALEGKTRCMRHLLKANEGSTKLRAGRIAAGLCVQCGCPAVLGTTQCEKHTIASRKANQKCYRARKAVRAN